MSLLMHLELFMMMMRCCTVEMPLFEVLKHSYYFKDFIFLLGWTTHFRAIEKLCTKIVKNVIICLFFKCLYAVYDEMHHWRFSLFFFPSDNQFLLRERRHLFYDIGQILQSLYGALFKYLFFILQCLQFLCFAACSSFYNLTNFNVWRPYLSDFNFFFFSFICSEILFHSISFWFDYICSHVTLIAYW